MSRALVEAQRRPLDSYYTPDDLAHALVGLIPHSALCPHGIGSAPVWEPHAGGGAFVRALREHGHDVVTSDIDPGAPCGLDAVGDFLALSAHDVSPSGEVSAVVGNPPYRHAEAHVRHALEQAPHVFLLMRLAMLESAKRAPLWQSAPLRRVWVLSQRPSFTGGGTDSAAYGFFWFARGYQGLPEIDWLWEWR